MLSRLKTRQNLPEVQFQDFFKENLLTELLLDRRTLGVGVLRNAVKLLGRQEGEDEDRDGTKICTVLSFVGNSHLSTSMEP